MADSSSDPEPPLTVAIPTCNGAAHLAEALRGIMAQEGVAFDLVVSDDRSDDATLELVRTLAGDRARIAVNRERLGLAGNWNRCVAMSVTPMVAVFHQDDVMEPGHLASHCAGIRRRRTDRAGRERNGGDRRSRRSGAGARRRARRTRRLRPHLYAG